MYKLTIIANFHSAIDKLQPSGSEPIASESYAQTTFYPTYSLVSINV